MAIFFNFILLFFIAIVLIIALFVYRLYSHIHRTVDNFRHQMGGQQPHPSHAYNGKNDEETVVDQRTPQEANKKIFTKDEGEYVDFQEIDHEH